VYVIDCYGPRYGASAGSGNAFTRYVFAAAFPLFTVQSKSKEAPSSFVRNPIVLTKMFAVYNRLTVKWAASLLGFLAVALIPIPWVLFTWGAAIRRKSKLSL
jgi:hypothetical protein